MEKNNIVKKSFTGIVFIVAICVLAIDFLTVVAEILNIFNSGEFLDDFLQEGLYSIIENAYFGIIICSIIFLALIESLILIFSHNKGSNNLYKINFYIFSLYIFAFLMYFAICFFIALM